MNKIRLRHDKKIGFSYPIHWVIMISYTMTLVLPFCNIQKMIKFINVLINFTDMMNVNCSF